LTKFDKPQLNHVPYGASTVVEVVVAVVVAIVAAAAPVGMEHLDVGRMPVNASCW
jgi:hypothetical protein